MAKIKWNDEKIKDYVSENTNGYILKEVVRSKKTRIYLMCDNGHEYDVNFDNFQKGKRCPYCKGNIKYKYTDVKKIIEIDSNSGCKLVSTEYKNTDEKLIIKCNCGNNFETSFYKFRNENKRTCYNCTNKKLNLMYRNSIEYVSEQIDKLSLGNVKLIDEYYINGKTPIKLLCRCGNEFHVKYNDFLSNKQYQCPPCGLKKRSEIKRLDIQEVKNYIESNGYELLSEYTVQNIPLIVKCSNNHISHMFYNNFKRGARCQACYFDNMGGENSYAWKGGISSLSEYLRGSIIEWKNKSKILSKYKCVLTGDDFSIIHHLYSFNKIVNETLTELNLPLFKEINKYTKQELESLNEKCLEIHYRYPLGVCLRDDVHYLFHNLYGKNNNTPEQFYEFTKRFQSGEFNNIPNREVG